MAEDRKVVAYYPDWEEYQEEKLPFDILTHVVYCFAVPRADGSIRILEHPKRAEMLVQRAHEQNVSVLLAVGGWGYEGIRLEDTFVQATDSRDKIVRLSNIIMYLCREYGFDGIDIDWEHPRIGEKSGVQYEEFMLHLAELLHAEGKVLTSAVIGAAKAEGGNDKDAAAHSDKVLNAVDWIHVMAYDGGDGILHSTYEFAAACAEYWRKERRMPAEKIVLGVPFYARPGWMPYRNILECNPGAGETDFCEADGMEIWYNGINTIKRKAEYAKENLGGIMVWEATQDAAGEASLLRAVGEVMQTL